MENKTPLMSLRNIDMVFKKPGSLRKDRFLHVLRDVNLDIYDGEIIALVGESGCGKTTLGKIITGLYKPTSGSIYFEGEKVTGLFSKNINNLDAVQFIQQDSYAALNPVRTIYQSLYAPLKNKHRHWSKEQIDKKIDDLMATIGLYPAEQYLQNVNHVLIL